MASRRLIVDDLIAEVRSLMDEEDTENLQDEQDILPALNRAQDEAANILARHYEEPLLTEETVTLTAGVQDYDLPEEAMEGRLEKVEIRVGGFYYEVDRISYRHGTPYEVDQNVQIPRYYAVIGNKYRFYPAPNGASEARIFYNKNPETLVRQQGRITSINVANGYVFVDNPGDSLTTEVDDLNSYVNLVDGQSGNIKATMQIQSISNNQIIFKSTPTRSSVLNKTIIGAIPTTVEPDDYLCTVHGSCVPFFKKPTSNFMIQHAVANLNRKMGAPADMELRILDDYRQQVERSWVGREQSRRVKRVNTNFSRPYRRYLNNSNGNN